MALLDVTGLQCVIKRQGNFIQAHAGLVPQASSRRSSHCCKLEFKLSSPYDFCGCYFDAYPLNVNGQQCDHQVVLACHRCPESHKRIVRAGFADFATLKTLMSTGQQGLGQVST
ncbi:unnamed protein product [Phytophthora fragariaefolia]|uniref:Unnamed protein product n=1 Tax=Phytophthora fragariaefolia TaxID=1490495 RepID=A0A9W7CWT6_9STRA|nr:unnamed protein product [Phytophthora fragariaefolia]